MRSESPKASTCFTPMDCNISKSNNNASYSIWLFVQYSSNRFENSKTAPHGNTRTTPIPLPSSQIDPSK
jgi:hypothetical protein